MSIQGINIGGQTDSILNITNNITNNTTNITGSGVGSSFIAISGVINGNDTIIWNHNLGSDNIEPKLYIRHAQPHSNNWEPMVYDYNDVRFESGYAAYGIYDFRTGTNPFMGWSGLNLGGTSFFGFSGGIIRAVSTALSVDFPTTNNSFAAPCLVKRYVGDFDVWTDITGLYNANFNGNGLIAISLGETGATPGVSAFSVGNVFNTFPTTEQKWRDIHGNNDDLTLRNSVRFWRLRRQAGVVSAYYKTGVTDVWTPFYSTVTSRNTINILRDEVLIGGFIQTVNVSSNGNEYRWNFIKKWSPLELRASGSNSIAIINNSPMGSEFKVVIPTTGFDLTTGIAGPKGSYYFIIPNTIDTASNNLIPDLYSNENNTAYEFGATLKVPCSGQPILGNISKNGSNLFAFTIPTGVRQVTSGLANLPIASGDVLSASLSQVGTTSAGTTLTLSINVK